MLKTLISLILLSSFAYASAPTFTVGTDPLIDITSTGTGLSLGDDQMSGMKNIGFDFTFYDQTFSQVNISMNGFFTFQSNFSVPRSRNYLSETLPATSFNYSVFPAWSDYIRRSSGNKSPYIQTFGQTADTDQYFVIMWDNVSEYSNGLKSTFQAILYETTNEISFRYDELRIQNHDITIGLQGNNEAVTYLRYEDNNSTTYVVTDDFSLTTAEVIDESFSNLSSECLVDADFSELCDVYDLTNNFEDDDYLYGTGLTDSVLFGYDDEEDFYGFDEEDEYLYGETTFFTFADDWNEHGDSHDVITISSDILFVEEYDLEEPVFIDTHFEFTEDSFTPDLEEISFIPLEDITDTEVIDIFEIHAIDTEEDFLMFVEEELTEEEFAEVIEEHFNEEEAIEEEEQALDEAVEEITPDQVDEEEFTEDDFIEQELELLENIDEEKDTKKEKRNRIRSIVASTNSLLERINPNITGGTSQTSTTVSVSSNTSGGSSPMSITSSPSISDQIASSQAQTNTVLQSINLVPMPAVGNTPSMMMAEVQVTTMENQIESMTSTMVTASEADQIAEQIVASNIRAQQEQSQQQEQESGRYDTQGQANLLAYMNYLPGFDTYQNMSIPQPTEWYEPRAIYTDVTIDDNYVGYGIMIGNNINTLSGMVSEQSEDLFGG